MTDKKAPSISKSDEEPAIRPVNQCVAAILTGGRSSRMGTDKSRLRLVGVTYLQWIRAAVDAAGISVFTVRNDDRPGCGPLGGMRTALRRAASRSGVEGCLILSCDMPLVRSFLLRTMWEIFQKSGRPVVCRDLFAFGFPWLLRLADAELIDKQLAEGKRSLQEMAKLLDPRVIQLVAETEWQRTNVNTPEEHRNLEGWVTRRNLRPESMDSSEHPYLSD